MLSWFFSVIIIEPFYDDFHFKNHRTFYNYSLNRPALSAKSFKNCATLCSRIDKSIELFFSVQAFKWMESGVVRRCMEYTLRDTRAWVGNVMSTWAFHSPISLCPFVQNSPPPPTRLCTSAFTLDAAMLGSRTVYLIAPRASKGD